LPVTLLGIMTVGAYGLVLYAFGVFVGPIRDDTGWSNTTVSSAFSVSALLGGLGALASGRLLDRIGIRPVITGSLISGASLLWVAASATDPLWFVVSWGVGGGIVSAGLFYNTTMAATTRLTPSAERPRAFSWLTVLGGLAAPATFPLAGWMVEAWGWRDAVRGMVGFLVVCSLPAIVFVRGGSALDAPAHPTQTDAHHGFADAAEALRSPTVRRWLVAVAAAMMSLVAIQVNHVPALEASGLTLGAATTLASIRGLLSLPGRAAGAPLVSYWGTVPALRLTYVMMAVGTAALIPGGSSVWAFVIITGLAFGTVAPLQGLYAAELYGPRRIGTLMGMQQVVMSVASAAGPFLLGITVDLTGGYTMLLLLAIALNVVALAVFRSPDVDRASRVRSTS
jgi:MFS family permease